MWLLNTSTYQLVFEKYPSHAHYTVVSHVWDPVEQNVQVCTSPLSSRTPFEAHVQEVETIHASARSKFGNVLEDTDPLLLDTIRAKLSPKIRCCCDYARAHGYPYIWIDTCCIDKTSSAELSEAINSMFAWYSLAAICYIYLSDVSASDDPAAPDSSFRRSRWFKRGWTLQELIVPSRSIFLTRDWRKIGTKAILANIVESVTKIDIDILLHKRQLHTVSVAARMAWAAGRETTRVEDEAYCLMGVFGVRFPVIYGEGSQAFIRLQEEIMRRIPDQSLFLWGFEQDIYRIPSPLRDSLRSVSGVPMDHLRASKSAYLFASCPMDFFHSKGFSPVPIGTFRDILGLPKVSPPLYTHSSHGVCATFPISALLCQNVEDDSVATIHLAILACQDVSGYIPALLLSSEVSSGRHIVGGIDYFLALDPESGRLRQRPRRPLCGGDAPLARKLAMHYARPNTRIVLIDLKVIKQELPPVLRDVCIPPQRMSAVSEFVITRSSPNPAPTVNGFTGFCKFVLPCWTLEHLSALGFSANVTIENGEMVPIALGANEQLPNSPSGVRPDRWSNGGHGYWRHDLTLTHGTRGKVVVTISTCPVIPHGPLHATVVWESGRNSPVVRLGIATPVSMFSWRGCNQLRLLDVDPVATTFRNPEQ